MTQNTATVKTTRPNPAGSFIMRMGNTTYVIGVHFSQTSKDTLEDKMKRLMRDEVKTDDF
ncbi:MAG: transposon-encoded TnpW family protein [Candidatus Fimisoma sp.]